MQFNIKTSMLTSREISQAKYQIDALDGLRGLAVLLVFLSHSSNRGIYLLPYLNLEGAGKSGVFLFFILSSFLLTYPFLENSKLNSRFFLNYSLRRVFRIYPLYFFYLSLGLASTYLLASYGSFSWLDPIPFSLTTTQFIDHLLLNSGFGVTWSIAVEFKYYFLLPLVAILYRLLSRASIATTLTATLLLISLAEYIWPESQSLQNDTRVWPYLPIFIMGAFSAYLYKYWQNNPQVQTKKIKNCIEIMGIVALITIVLMMPSVIAVIFPQDIARTEFHKHFWEYGALWTLVLLGCLCGDGYLRRCFESFPLRYLGFISFSLYLVHVVVLNCLDKLPEKLFLHGWIALILSVAISHITWILIEKPFAKVKLR